MVPFVSIIVPCYNEEKFIRQLLENVIEQDYPAGQVEIIVIDGMSCDGTRDEIKKMIARDQRIRLLDNERKYVPYALNKAILESRGEFIVRMDAHANYPVSYLSVLIRNMEELKADNVGVAWITLPASDTVKCHAIAAAMSSSFGIGNAQYRLGTNEVKQVDTVPFGCYRREVFNRIGLFDESLLRNQDDEFNGRLSQHGGKIFLLPGHEIRYYARGKVQSMTRMFYQYGLFKPLVNRRLNKPATARQFVPPVFVAYLASLVILFFLLPGAAAWYSMFLGLYLVFNIYFSVSASARSGKGSLVFFLPWLFFLIHLSYGSGYIAGIYKFVLLSGNRPVIPSSR